MEMVKIKVITALALLCGVSAAAQNFTWSTPAMDGSRAGTTIPTVENVDEALGRMEGKKYVAPNGKVYKKGSTPAVAKLMIDAQPTMAPVKEYVGFTTHELSRRDPELGNLIVDCIMAGAQEATGIKIDAGLTNNGGIRIDLPEGKIVLDDIMSMLPFKNYIAVLEMKGSELRRLFGDLAKERMQVVGGFTGTIKDGEVLEVLVGGKPIDDAATYHLATIDFLLTGGDNIFAAKYASDLVQTEVLIRDAVLSYLAGLKEAGKAIEYDNTVRVNDLTERRRPR